MKISLFLFVQSVVSFSAAVVFTLAQMLTVYFLSHNFIASVKQLHSLPTGDRS